VNDHICRLGARMLATLGETEAPMADHGKAPLALVPRRDVHHRALTLLTSGDRQSAATDGFVAGVHDVARDQAYLRGTVPTCATAVWRKAYDEGVIWARALLESTNG
jgi:hypothetical protein